MAIENTLPQALDTDQILKQAVDKAVLLGKLPQDNITQKHIDQIAFIAQNKNADENFKTFQNEMRPMEIAQSLFAKSESDANLNWLKVGAYAQSMLGFEASRSENYKEFVKERKTQNQIKTYSDAGKFITAAELPSVIDKLNAYGLYSAYTKATQAQKQSVQQIVENQIGATKDNSLLLSKSGPMSGKEGGEEKALQSAYGKDDFQKLQDDVNQQTFAQDEEAYKRTQEEESGSEEETGAESTGKAGDKVKWGLIAGSIGAGAGGLTWLTASSENSQNATVQLSYIFHHFGDMIASALHFSFHSIA